MSKIKICLDAGHAGKYNRSAVVPEYYESDMNWKLHLKLKAELEKYGIEVITTRANQNTDRGLNDRGAAAKGCNLFLSIHANACDTESVDYPLVIVPINGSGDAIGQKLAQCIEDTMDTKQKCDVWDKKSDKGYDWYGVIRGAASVGVPGLILEHSFYTNTRAAKWLMVDANLDKLAQAEAAVIAAHYGLSKNTTTTKTEVQYTVTATSNFKNKAEAEEVVSKLIKAGFIADIVEQTIVIEVPVAPAKPAPTPTPAPAAPAKKSAEEVAKEVLNGKWGNGQERKNKLTAAGYNYSEIQKIVNKLASGETVSQPAKKSITEIAKEVINGDWGNGQDRKNRLTAAGYDYAEVQKKVNELCK